MWKEVEIGNEILRSKAHGKRVNSEEEDGYTKGVKSLEIPRCESCGRIAQYKCSIDWKYVCCECARFVTVSGKHLPKRSTPKISIKVMEKMKQDAKERSIFEALEELTECPPPGEVNFEEKWKPSQSSVYGPLQSYDYGGLC
jgi:hypothetical protein